MKDSIVKRLKDQLFVARAYYFSIAKLEGMEKLSREMKQNIQEHEHMLSEAIYDADIPKFYGLNMAKMDQPIAAAKSCAIECTNFEKKLRQLLDMTEDKAHFHASQSAHLYSLGVQTLPKSLHCLSMRLTVDYFKSFADMEYSDAQKLENPVLRHYVIFSTNLGQVRSPLCLQVEGSSWLFGCMGISDDMRSWWFGVSFDFMASAWGQADIQGGRNVMDRQWAMSWVVCTWAGLGHGPSWRQGQYRAVATAAGGASKKHLRLSHSSSSSSVVAFPLSSSLIPSSPMLSSSQS